MKRWIIAGGLSALLTTGLLATFACTGPEPVSTQDINAIDEYMNGSLHPAGFVLGVPREEVVLKALESAGRALAGKDTSALETRATVGLYTWNDEKGNWVAGRKARLVVADDLPKTFPSGFAGTTVAARGKTTSWSCSTMRTLARKSRAPLEGAGLTRRTRRPAIGNPAVIITKSGRLGT